ncbi:hypothetical protein, partial [Pseudomonas gessardii]|uniref:hypothetical protein n=1 Tax=Pseudomonas gessardii TaxID=78544 RepID=UPI001F29F0CD
ETRPETSLSLTPIKATIIAKTPENLFKNQAVPPEVFSLICHRKLRTSCPWPRPASLLDHGV